MMIIKICFFIIIIFILFCSFIRRVLKDQSGSAGRRQGRVARAWENDRSGVQGRGPKKPSRQVTGPSLYVYFIFIFIPFFFIYHLHVRAHTPKNINIHIKLTFYVTDNLTTRVLNRFNH